MEDGKDTENDEDAVRPAVWYLIDKMDYGRQQAPRPAKGGRGFMWGGEGAHTERVAVAFAASKGSLSGVNDFTLATWKTRVPLLRSNLVDASPLYYTGHWHWHSHPTLPDLLPSCSFQVDSHYSVCSIFSEHTPDAQQPAYNTSFFHEKHSWQVPFRILWSPF